MASKIYLPKEFDYSENETLIQTLLGSVCFGQLLSSDQAGDISISYAPVEVDIKNKQMIFHLSHSNDHCNSLGDGARMTFVWNGPGVYISPTMYVNNSVPTWNYAVILIDGIAETINDYDQKTTHLTRLADQYEPATAANHWTMDSLGNERIQRAINRLQFYRASITAVRAKIKMSQNKPSEDREAVRMHLTQSEASEEVIALMSHTMTEN